jgi:hypothetical protein
MKALLIVISIFVMAVAQADYATTPQPYPPQYNPQPQPYYPAPAVYYGNYVYPAPYPMYPHYVTCFAQGMANGAVFYGLGMDVYSANQWAMYACNSTGQYCALTGCRY